MNAVLIAIIVMLLLSLLRAHVVISLLIGAITAGLVAGLPLKETLNAFNTGISNGASIALSYALLGAFAVAISKSGLPHALADIALKQLGSASNKTRLKWAMLFLLVIVSVSSQNIIPIHIAFIPLLIPPLLYVMSRLHLDRRAVACAIAFGLTTPYMFLPIGFGDIFLNKILLANVAKGGVDISHINVMHAMLFPALGMVSGLIIALFISYRRPRHYDMKLVEQQRESTTTLNKKSIFVSIFAILSAFAIQLYSGSMMLGALVGFLLFIASGTIKWRDADDTFSQGVKMMALIGFIMITAQGFAEVLQQTGEIDSLVNSSVSLFAGNKGLAAFAMLFIGLIITMGIGSSFSTVPVIAAIYVPLCLQMGFSPMATICLIGAAGAIGDAGSPASETTLAATGGLNTDGQHDHIRDTVIPTFIHYNIPLFIAAWIGAMVL